ncbi:hypothetical protein NCAS_0I01320 [Naumovozyma castellii]|uniref:K Homology domain-containing protein n=1 Tax=Naumovozyma castellii TaxID=27288 RepID=G0VJW8_NAUCA|nr:hypothetical protein NCAS_0I01320 [Naumovozyma castellii CBS 4309]CCC71800.1 hypothetical protein NCAS_0I01320 [Naumovozyma castellii CBS 4309]
MTETTPIETAPLSEEQQPVSSPETTTTDSGSEQEQEQEQSPATSASNNIVTLKLLLSLAESAAIIGLKGARIQELKSTNHVNINISEKVPGCSDRILTCKGTLSGVANTIKDITVVLNKEITTPADKPSTFQFLNSKMAEPTLSDFQTLETLDHVRSVRLILSNVKISTIIGKQAATFKKICHDNDVRMVATRNFLPDSRERILEIQSDPEHIKKAVLDILEIITDNSNTALELNERIYTPHVGRAPNASHSNQQYQAVVMVPEYLVGAMMGHGGSRIANLRKFTKTSVKIEKNEEDETKRKFTILGNVEKNVKSAETMMMRNLDAEIERHHERRSHDENKNENDKSETTTAEETSNKPIAVEF